MIYFDPERETYHSSKIFSPIIHGFGTRQTSELSTFLQFNTHVNLEQVHGNKTAIIENQLGKPAVKLPATDGVITNQSKILLTVKTADCIPLIFADPVNKFVGISHQGWKGTLLRLPQKMVSKFSNLNPSTSLRTRSEIFNLIVAIGPAIGACCYTIDDERKTQFKQEFPQFEDRIFQELKGETHLNLSYLCFLQLIEVGIKHENIDFFPFCTKCNINKFYSYRKGDKDKRMQSYIMIT